MKNDSIDKLTLQLKEMGVIRCVLHFKDKERRKKICDGEMGQRAVSMFHLAMGQKVEQEELVELFEGNGTKPKGLYVTAAIPQEEKDVLTLKLRDGHYRSMNERGVEIWAEQFEFKNEPYKKWYQFWK